MQKELNPAIHLRDGKLEAIIKPAQGGRLAELRYAGVDRIIPPGQVPGFHGDTFWPSPQERFDWPPPATLDEEPYTVLHQTAKTATVLSAPDAQFGFQFEKHFELKNETIQFHFQIKNIWDRPQRVAPWQVTRVPRSGILSWSSGEPFTDKDRLQKQREDPGCYYIHASDEKPFPALIAKHGKLSHLHVRDVEVTCKLFTDGHGWLTHLQEDCLILRTFPDILPAEAAPRHAEIELYFNPELSYIELENQGLYRTLEPLGSLDYKSCWQFFPRKPGELPSEIPATLEQSLSEILTHHQDT